MKIAVLPFEPTWNDPDHNSKRILEKLKILGQIQIPDLIIFPEASLTGFNTSGDLRSVKLTDNSITDIARWAADNRTIIWLGAFVEVEGKVQNCIVSLSANADCSVEILYSKINLFKFGGEHKRAFPGVEIKSLELGKLKVGVAICFDLRSLGLFRRYKDENVDLVVVPSSWPSRRDEHLETLAKARALDFEMGVLVVNRSGFDPESIEHSGQTKLFMPDASSAAGSRLTGDWTIFALDPETLKSHRLELMEGLNEQFTW